MTFSELHEGDAAPDFELATDGGETARLSDFRGKNVILYFYPKDDTSGCTKEACSFRDNYARLSRRQHDRARGEPRQCSVSSAFREKYDLPFKLLADPEPRRGGRVRRMG